MTEFVQINYDEVDNLAQLFQVNAEAINQLRARVQSGVDDLAGGGWEGQGSTRFLAEMNQEIFPATGRLAEALQEANRVTLLIVQIMRDADEEAAAPFRGGEGGPPAGGGQNGSGPASVDNRHRDTYLFGFIELDDRPKPSRELSTLEWVAVKGLGVISVGADAVSTFISGAGIVLEGAGVAVDGPSPVGDAVGVAAYYVALKPYETAISLVGVGATGVSDIIQGNTYISGSELVVGQDTLVAGTAFVGSLPFEGVGSTAINVGMLGYDTASLFGYSPTIAGHRWEMRIDAGEIPPRTYFVGYPPGE